MTSHPYGASTTCRLLVPLLAAAVATGCGGKPEYVAPPPPTVTVATPLQREVTDYVEMTGLIHAVSTVEIRARVVGFLVSIDYEEGDFVDAGDLLYTIDPDEYAARVERAKANRDRYFSAALVNDDHMLDLKSRPVEQIWKSFDSITSADTHFAGRRRGGRRHMSSGKEPLMCTDNEGGNTYLNGTVCDHRER